MVLLPRPSLLPLLVSVLLLPACGSSSKDPRASLVHGSEAGTGTGGTGWVELGGTRSDEGGRAGAPLAVLGGAPSTPLPSGGSSTTSNAGASSSQGGASGAPGVAGSAPFVHPGCLSTDVDLVRIKTKVTAGAQPWRGSWDLLVANPHAQLTYTSNPQTAICAGSCAAGENYMALAHDAAAAYQLALRYRISGDTAYAEKAGQILDGWSARLTTFTGDSNAGLRAALYGYQLACAGELLRGYGAWDPARTQGLLTGVFYPLHSDFLRRHNGACEGNYWANWDLAAMAAVLAIGVFADRRDIFDEGLRYFHTGVGEGSILNAVHYLHPDGSGQWQESGRDQGHNTLGPMLMGVVCEIAWNQGIDLYGAADNRFLAGSEYVTAYNLGSDVPYVAYVYTSGSGTSCNYSVQSTISSASRGIKRAGYDLIYNHYVNRKGASAPFTQAYAEAVRPEGGGGDYGTTSGGFDSLGFTTLTHALDPIAVAAAPSALRAFPKGTQLTLSWTGSAQASGYRVKRATASGGPYTTIATVDPNRTNQLVTGLIPGVIQYYVVSALTPLGETANSQELAAAADGQLTGSIIGTNGSFNSTGATRELAFDGSLANFFDGPDSVSWVGIDLGETTRGTVTTIRYAPRKGFENRMVGGKFQGSSSADFSSDVTDLFTVVDPPPSGVHSTQVVTSTSAYRYLRYVSPVNGYGNVAEVQFIGTFIAS